MKIISVILPKENSKLCLWYATRTRDIPKVDGTGFTKFYLAVPTTGTTQDAQGRGLFTRFRGSDSIRTSPVVLDGMHSCCHDRTDTILFGSGSAVNYSYIIGKDSTTPIGYHPELSDGSGVLLPPTGIVTKSGKVQEVFADFLAFAYSPGGTWNGTYWDYAFVKQQRPGIYTCTLVQATAVTPSALGMFRINIQATCYCIYSYLSPDKSLVYSAYNGYVSTTENALVAVSNWDNHRAYVKEMAGHADWIENYTLENTDLPDKEHQFPTIIFDPDFQLPFEPPSKTDVNRVLELLRIEQANVEDILRPVRDVDDREVWGPIVQSACDNTKYLSINTAAYIKDLRTLNEQLRLFKGLSEALSPVKSIKRSINKGKGFKGRMWNKLRVTTHETVIRKRSAKQILNAASSTYLSSKYGAKLTYLDTQEILKMSNRIKRDADKDQLCLDEQFPDMPKLYSSATALANAMERALIQPIPKSRARRISTEHLVESKTGIEYDDAQVERYATIYWKRYQSDNAVRQAVEALRRIDLYPTLTNWWDFIPYSFVVDWFYPVSDALGAIDAMNVIDKLGLRAYVRTAKVTCSGKMDTQWLGLTTVLGPLIFTHVFYRRDIFTDFIDLPNLLPKPSSSAHKHIPELTALWLQRAAR